MTLNVKKDFFKCIFLEDSCFWWMIYLWNWFSSLHLLGVGDKNISYAANITWVLIEIGILTLNIFLIQWSNCKGVYTFQVFNRHKNNLYHNSLKGINWIHEQLISKREKKKYIFFFFVGLFFSFAQQK